jgi:hypothetical protein
MFTTLVLTQRVVGTVESVHHQIARWSWTVHGSAKRRQTLDLLTTRTRKVKEKEMPIVCRSIAAANPNLGLDVVVYRDDVANQISTELGGQAGHKPASVSCPKDLAATVGATRRCNLTDAGQTYGVTVTVTNVDNVAGVSTFDILVDNEPSW